MPRTTEQNKALRSATRSAVETAAVRVFAHRGFAAANIRQIAVEAGISTGSIYRHYAGKEELFDELIEQASRGLGAVAAQLSTDGDPIAMIRSFTETYVADLVANNGAAEFYMVINQGFTTDTPEGTASRLAAAQRTLWRAFASLVERGQAEGQITAGEPARITAHYFAMLAGMTTMHVALREASAEPDVDLIIRILTGGTR
ncbi:TetR/AcrR family transcriptional regulator [Microbacterium murale]|uniref:AcrR family transcriptional regulator n=1 Tax=Microbacterium murale TaxID=1081040 RepID=A0ABU0P819_9MICO|nr:TetR/AcrR family transcriptional regulator [Microbacterium murale]MDQ0643483.1 AcrR family transcriptional regulator [Microbacterium murale]